jgi:hypothetical protein
MIDAFPILFLTGKADYHEARPHNVTEVALGIESNWGKIKLGKH